MIGTLYERGCTVERMGQKTGDTRTINERLAAAGVRKEKVERSPGIFRFYDVASGALLGIGDAVDACTLIYQREDAARGAPVHVVGWINPADRTQAGEFRTRDAAAAQSFADAKRAAGCEVEQLRG
jgi:hypothetical protein